jgi:hypothetical protein
MYFYYKTPRGTVSLVQRAGRWHVMFQDEDLGSYITAGMAADDVGGGHTFMPSSGIDLGSLDIPRDLDRWEQGKP